MQLVKVTPLKNEDLNLKSVLNEKVIPRSGSKYIIVYFLPPVKSSCFPAPISLLSTTDILKPT